MSTFLDVAAAFAADTNNYMHGNGIAPATLGSREIYNTNVKSICGIVSRQVRYAPFNPVAREII